MKQMIFAIAVGAVAFSVYAASKAMPIAPVQEAIAASTDEVIPTYYYRGRGSYSCPDDYYCLYHWHGYYYRYRWDDDYLYYRHRHR